MNDIPSAVLSEQFEKRLDGRRLVAAVFLTFRFDPAFFEQQVLPVFVDIPTSHADAIKRVQLEQALTEVPHRVAVYYDRNGLAAEAKPSRLDIARIPVFHKRGIFHPKNVFALVENRDPDESGHRAQALIVGCMSANLTQAGWWENVEACHIEEIVEGETTRLKEDLVDFLSRLEQRVGEKDPNGHASLKAIKAFLRSTDQRLVRTAGGWLHPHFFDGSLSFCDFLRATAGSALENLYLEIISPYFDVGPESQPLKDLIAEFRPKEVRIFLPRKETGDALCSQEIFDWVREQPLVKWGRLPREVTRGGRSENAKSRMVHAKVYRFFLANPKREYLFVGSVNLTMPAHQRGGNLETGFFVEINSPRRPEWWLELDGTTPKVYENRSEETDAVSTAGSRLTLQYRWNTKQILAYWDDEATSPDLSVKWNGDSLFVIKSLPIRQWVLQGAESAVAMERVLQTTSIVLVDGDRTDPVPVLVQEEGMAHRPSLLFDLTPAEILQYWSLLTIEQRAAFLEVHAPEAALTIEGAERIADRVKLISVDSFFDRFAGIFISFGRLESNVREALAMDNSRAAVYRLFGQKYDSLGRLLSRVREDHEKTKTGIVEHYVMVLCARQMVSELKRAEPDFFKDHKDEVRELEHQLAIGCELRDALAKEGDESMKDFLAWFERWFLQRAEPIKQEASHD